MFRYVAKRQAGVQPEKILIKAGAKMIFSEEMEASFVDYVKFRAQTCYGMTALAT